MFVSHRSFAAPSLPASLETLAVLHARFRLHRVCNHHVVAEDALGLRAFERKGHVGRPTLTVVLAGRARLEAYGATRWLEPGSVALVEHKSAVRMRQQGACFASLALEWEPGSLGTQTPRGFAVEQLSPGDLASLRAAAARLPTRADDPRALGPAVCHLLGLLRAVGAPLDPLDPGALGEPVPAHTLTVAAALDRALSRLAERPMAVDLETALGLSARQVNRLVADFNRQYGFNAEGWRDTRNRRRLLVAAALMTAPRATTESVAALVGYSSPTALCRAFADAGLPSPARVPEVVAALV